MSIRSLVLAILCVVACRGTERNVTRDLRDMKAVTIPVKGMACDSCAERVEHTVAELEGVGDAEVRFDDKLARVRYDPDVVSPARIADAIHDLGFEVGTPREAP